MKVLDKNLMPGAAMDMGGLAMTGLRWVAGWTYFSAFWRRMVLEDKLNPEAAGYVGEKFNHFLPNALFIKPMIEWLVSSPDVLPGFLTVFTLIEAVVGLFFMLGLFTRLMSVGVIALAGGILLGAGWLGTTCLDEWQIGVLGMAAGMAAWYAGAGPTSLDGLLLAKRPALGGKKWFLLLASGSLLPWLRPRALRLTAVLSAVLMLGITLYTNQAFHGGVWGKLHNLSVKPHVQLSDISADAGHLTFTVYRNEGADVYGSFTIAARITTASGELVKAYDDEALAALKPGSIKNHYVAKVKTGKHSLILPLGARAAIQLPLQNALPPGSYRLELEDISGLSWHKDFTL